MYTKVDCDTELRLEDDLASYIDWPNPHDLLTNEILAERDSGRPRFWQASVRGGDTSVTSDGPHDT